MYKEDFLAIGGHDNLFAPQSKEDSDLFNRMQLAGYKFIQPWNALVYHFTSRGSRFNKHSGGAAGKDSNEWIQTTTKNGREFIRKWGHFIKHDRFMKPIIPPKYDIGLILNNCNNIQFLEALEPWCSNVYVDNVRLKYITMEQPKTRYSLSYRVLPLENDKLNDILIEIDCTKFDNTEFNYIQNMSEIISSDSDIETGSFELGRLKITILDLKTVKQDIIVCES